MQLPDAASLSRTEDVTKQLLEMVEQEWKRYWCTTLVNGYAFDGRFCFPMARRRYFIKLHDWDIRNALDGQHSPGYRGSINGRAALRLPERLYLRWDLQPFRVWVLLLVSGDLEDTFRP
ncbi:hypothetical protein O9993_00545 [Vibrio lentus]|nr:hypothetical protein [Vibrio lentus]